MHLASPAHILPWQNGELHGMHFTTIEKKYCRVHRGQRVKGKWERQETQSWGGGGVGRCLRKFLGERGPLNQEEGTVESRGVSALSSSQGIGVGEG